jgi:hypothetical protein
VVEGRWWIVFRNLRVFQLLAATTTHMLCLLFPWTSSWSKQHVPHGLPRTLCSTAHTAPCTTWAPELHAGRAPRLALATNYALRVPHQVPLDKSGWRFYKARTHGTNRFDTLSTPGLLLTILLLNLVMQTPDVDHVDSWTHFLEVEPYEHFGQDVSQMIICSCVTNLNLSLLCTLPHQVVLNFNVFASST